MFPVMKQNGWVRTCGDYCVTVNQAIRFNTPSTKGKRAVLSFSWRKVRILENHIMLQVYLQLQLE